MEALLTPPPDDSSSRKRRAPSPEREMTKAEGKRREFIKPPQCNRQRHTSIYNGNASVASVVGESIFEHECDETLGKPQCKPEDKAGPAEKLGAARNIWWPLRSALLTLTLPDAQSARLRKSAVDSQSTACFDDA